MGVGSNSIQRSLGGRQIRHQSDRGDSSITQTLEVGYAYGLSSLHICSAIQGRKNAHHTIIDPFQAQPVAINRPIKSQVEYVEDGRI